MNRIRFYEYVCVVCGFVVFFVVVVLAPKLSIETGMNLRGKEEGF